MRPRLFYQPKQINLAPFGYGQWHSRFQTGYTEPLYPQGTKPYQAEIVALAKGTEGVMKQSGEGVKGVPQKPPIKKVPPKPATPKPVKKEEKPSD